MRVFRHKIILRNYIMPESFQNILDDIHKKSVLLMDINELRRTKSGSINIHYKAVIETELWSFITMIDDFKMKVLESMGELNNPMLNTSRLPNTHFE